MTGAWEEAAAALDAGEPDQVLAQVGGSSEPVASALRDTAQGLLHERSGDVGLAVTCFVEAAESASPVAAVLRVAGSALQRLGAADLAFDCVVRLDALEPGSAVAFSAGLPAADQVRYAAYLVPALLHRPQPLLYSLQPLKAEMARQLGPEAAARTYAKAAGIVATPVTRRVRPLSAFAEQHGEQFEHVAAARDVTLPAPDVFGLETSAPATARSRGQWFGVLRDAIVSGKSNLVAVGDSVLLDAEADELALYPLDLDVDPTVIAPTEATVVSVLADDRPVVPQAISLLGVHSYNFGHWLVEFLPKVWACLDRPGFDDVVVLVDEQMHREHVPALRAFLPPGHPVRVVRPGEAVLVEHLWSVPMATYFPLGPRAGASETDEPTPIDAQHFASLISRVASTPPVLGEARRKLYLSRQDSQHRRLVNRIDVEELVRARGFEVYDPGSLTFDEQLRRVRSARTILGPDGSALWLSFLAPSGTSVGYLNNPYLEEHWWLAALHQARGHRMTVLTGRVVNEVAAYRKFSDYEIDLDELAAYLDAAES